MADLGPFQIDIDPTLMLPEVPLSQTSSIQNVAIDAPNDILYGTQGVQGGLQFPGEPAPLTLAQRALAGDLGITQFDRSGNITGIMYVLGAGHGVSLSAESVGADTYLWMEADSQPDGTFGLGAKVGRVKFVNGAIIHQGDLALEVFDPIPGFRRVFNTLDIPNNRIAVSYADLTPARTRRYRIYDLALFKTGVYVPLLPEFVGLTTGLQNSMLYGDFLYQLSGTSTGPTNPIPGNTHISVIDVNTGLTLEDSFVGIDPDLTDREPEALNIDYGFGDPRLYFSFTTNEPAPIRFVTLYYWNLRSPFTFEGTWAFTTPTVEEAPFAWNDLMVRYRIPRGISLQEVAPCQYEEVRYYAYTDELGAENLPTNPNQDTDFWPAPSEGLNFFRGGYEHTVSGATKACLIASGLVDESNFTLISSGFGEFGFGEGGFGGTP